MKNLIFILMFFLSFRLSAEINTPQGKNQKIYQELKKQDLNTDSLIKVINSLSITSKDKAFFDYLLMLAYGNDGDIQKIDSIYKITSYGFLENRNKFMDFETRQAYGSLLNLHQKYEDAYQILNNSITEIDRIPVDNRSNDLEHIRALTAYEIAFNLMKTHKLTQSDKFIQEAIKSFIKVNDSTTLIESYNLSGVIYKRLSLTNKAIEQYKHAYDLTQKTKDTRLSKIILNNIACLYNEINECEKAIYFARKIVNDFPASQDQSMKSKIDHILSLNTLGVLLDNAKLHRNGIDTLTLAIQTFNENTPDGLKFLIYTNLAKAFNGNNQIDSASIYFSKALLLRKDTKHAENIANLDYLYGSFLADRFKDFENAHFYLNESLAFYRQNPSELYIKNLLALAKLEATHFKNYAKAYELMQEAYDFDESLQSDIYQKKLAGFEAEFRTKEKEIQITKLQAKQEKEKAIHQFQMLCSTALVIIFLLLIIILFIHMHKRKIGFELKEAELKNEIAQKDFKSKLLMQEMDHRLTDKYVSGLEDSSKRMSKELHDNICNRMLALEMELNGHIPSEHLIELTDVRNEVRNLSHQLASPEFSSLSLIDTLKLYIDKLNSANLFIVHFFSTDELNYIEVAPQTKLEIYRIFQEAISNIIKHANAANVYITINKNQDWIELLIEDDGTGFNTKDTKSGLGLRNINERIKNINGDWSLSSKRNSGTIIHFKFRI